MVDLSKPYAEMSPAERAEADAMLAAAEAARPEGSEPEPVGHFTAGVFVFIDGSFRGITSDIATCWASLLPSLDGLSRQLPIAHRVDYWRECVEAGNMIALAFLDMAEARMIGAGLLNCEPTADGRRIISVAIQSLAPIDLESVSNVAEAAAITMEADAVQIWTPLEAPLAPGYQRMLSLNADGLECGYFQVAATRPIQ
jgi:hypothetical protein